MKKINKKVLIGLIINLLVMIVGIYRLSGEYGWDSLTKGFAAVMLLAFLTSLAGVALLTRGNPAGGIVGAVGSAFFVPIGLICMIGCLQSRDNIRFAGHAPGRIHQTGETKPAESAPTTEPMRDGMETRPAAPAIPPARMKNTQATSAVPVERPLIAYKFTDDACRFSCAGNGSGAGFYTLSIGAGSGPAFLLVGVSIAIIIRDSRRQDMHVYALYRDHLECVPARGPALSASPMRTSLRLKCSATGSAFTSKNQTGREKITIPLGSIPSGRARGSP